jgi:hypothetical protein
MLKVFVTINCNLCGQPFDRIAISTNRYPMAWRNLADDAEYYARNRAWHSQQSAHHCDYCVHHAITAGRNAAAKGIVENESDF